MSLNFAVRSGLSAAYAASILRQYPLTAFWTWGTTCGGLRAGQRRERWLSCRWLLKRSSFRWPRANPLSHLEDQRRLWAGVGSQRPDLCQFCTWVWLSQQLKSTQNFGYSYSHSNRYLRLMALSTSAQGMSVNRMRWGGRGMISTSSSSLELGMVWKLNLNYKKIIVLTY